MCACVCVAVEVVDPHAPGGAKHFDRVSNKRKYDEMSVRTRVELSCVSLTASVPCCQGAESGNYTLEMAKSRLHLFLQQTRQPKDMQVRPVGPDHNRWDVCALYIRGRRHTHTHTHTHHTTTFLRSFVAEMTIYVPKLHRSKIFSL